jgi:hypothetical protein
MTGIGHNLPNARDWLYAVLHSGEVTQISQHLALVIFHSVDEDGHLKASARDLERITGWGRQTIADHLGELKVFMSVQLGVGRAKSTFDLQCKITRAVNELRCVRELDANGLRYVHEADETQARLVHLPDATATNSVQVADAKTVRQPDATVVSTVVVVQPDAKSVPSRARIESSLREDSYTLEVVSEEKEEAGADAPSALSAQQAFDAYNELAQRVGLPLARSLTPERRRSIIKRMRDNGGEPSWRSLLSNVERSAFLQGDNDRGWRVPGLDWLLKSANFTKVIEGTYGNGAHARPKESNLERLDRLLGDSEPTHGRLIT